MRTKLTKKKVIAIICGIVFIMLSDLIICRKTYYLPRADIFVQQRNPGIVVHNYFGQHLSSIIFKRYKSLDIVYIDHLSDVGPAIYLDPDNQILFLTYCFETINRITPVSEHIFKCEMIPLKDLPYYDRNIYEVFQFDYQNEYLKEPYSRIYNCHWLLFTDFSAAPSKKAHLYHIFKIPKRKYNSPPSDEEISFPLPLLRLKPDEVCESGR